MNIWKYLNTDPIVYMNSSALEITKQNDGITLKKIVYSMDPVVYGADKTNLTDPFISSNQLGTSSSELSSASSWVFWE